ncbi:hypothetical protein [Virgibacillus alimentarius]|uniref:hypothetical protein n=1 Tax=Virgibacillus alimentarius TaxID=698769 RepID=UPI0004937C52|nr:hypothetical protein [Virgibacillus alimentarius]
MENRIFVFAFNKNDTINNCKSPSVLYRGYFDGENFNPKPGFCSSIDDLYEYDFVQLFGDDGDKCHIPKRYYGDLLKKMHQSFVEVFGEEQQQKLF